MLVYGGKQSKVKFPQTIKKTVIGKYWILARNVYENHRTLDKFNM